MISQTFPPGHLETLLATRDHQPVAALRPGPQHRQITNYGWSTDPERVLVRRACQYREGPDTTTLIGSLNRSINWLHASLPLEAVGQFGIAPASSMKL